LKGLDPLKIEFEETSPVGSLRLLSRTFSGQANVRKKLEQKWDSFDEVSPVLLV
jgi:hypothetical protein